VCTNVYTPCARDDSLDIVAMTPHTIGMLTLSVREAQAYYIVAGLKTVENRTWATSYRGPLLIHVSGQAGTMADPIAEGESRLPVGYEYWRMLGLDKKKKQESGKYWVREGEKLVFGRGPFDPEIEREYLFWDRIFRLDPPGLPTQAIIGIVDLVEIVCDSTNKWAERGNYHWILNNARWPGRPIIGVAGKVKPFDFPDEKIPEVWR